ncbi:hypothetical protein CYY_008970 [Polysphondylium violaceum]|uniref:SURF1-like protein n=1 Tax=Polysphondylium violaceum TaxID=133409 RepID=A0A8J4PM95_9MYCE|nr:hypothetical protein CYY_008970 [Polysphondylium violaceum]
MQQSKRSFKVFIIFPIISAGLGTWQVYRYFWKKELIENAVAKTELDPIQLNDNVDNLLHNNQPFEFRRISVQGQLDPNKEIRLGPRGDGNGIIGYYTISPLTLDDGKTILINRGWKPNPAKTNYRNPTLISNDATTTSENKQPITDVNVLGLVSKKKERGSMFTPENKPMYNQWYYLDVEEMSKVYNTLPIMINAIEEDETIDNGKKKTTKKLQDNSQIKRFDTDVESNFHNKHMSYIGTWYSLSGCLTFIYFKFMRVPKI